MNDADSVLNQLKCLLTAQLSLNDKQLLEFVQKVDEDKQISDDVVYLQKRLHRLLSD